MYKKIRAGFIGFGEVNTPMEIIENRTNEAKNFLTSLGLEVVSSTPVTDSPDGSCADRASKELSGADFDFLVVCLVGWIPTWAVIRTISPFKDKPMLLWGLTGGYEDDRFVTAAAQAGTTALRKPMKDMKFRFKYIVDILGEKMSSEKILSFARVAYTERQLKTSLVGMAGYRDMRLYGTLYDAISLKEKVGIEIEHFETMELGLYMKEVSDQEIHKLIDYMKDNWIFTKEPQKETLHNTAKLYLAFKRKIEERKYVGVSYNDVDGIKKLMKFAPAGALTLLHDKMKICSIPENDSMGLVTQIITYFLTGQIPAYLEFYEFTKKGALMGVPDYIPADIVDGKTTILPNAFGSFGEGLLNVSKIKTGRMTIARLDISAGEYLFHTTVGNSRAPLKWEEAGWAQPAPQLPSVEVDFDFGNENFIQNVLGQHYIISYGDTTKDYKTFCELLNIKYQQD
ncbi:hypothetical protein M0P98_02515 [bacterium]|nr:hypothetical protein [bacterium]